MPEFHKKNLFTKTFNIKIFSRFYINFWTVPLVVSAILGGYITEFAAAYSTALIHELAHVFCAGILGVGISHITVCPFGICAVLSKGCISSSYKEFFIAVAGPLSNAVMYFVCALLNAENPSDIMLLIMNINTAMCFVNLLPILPLDGGRMFKALLASNFGFIPAYNFTLRLSRILTALLSAAAIWLFAVSGFNFSLVLVTAFLLNNLCSEQRSLSIITLREILTRKSEENTIQTRRVLPLCVSADTPAREILRYLSFDRSCIIYVKTRFGKVVKTLTETEVLAALCSQGIRITYGDIARLR